MNLMIHGVKAFGVGEVLLSRANPCPSDGTALLCT